MKVHLLLAILPICIRDGAYALSAVPNSPCYEICEGQNATMASALVRADSEYETKTRGVLMKACLECFQDSTYYSPDQTAPRDNDMYDFIYQMQMTIKSCLLRVYGDTTRHVPNIDTCSEYCEPMRPQMEQQWWNLTKPGPWNYCTVNESAFNNNARECASCHQSFEGSVVIGNFLEAMIAGCDQEPVPADSTSISLTRKLFDLEPIDGGAAKYTITGSATPTAPTPSSATGATEDSNELDSGPAPAPASASETSSAAEPTSSSSSGLSAAATGGIGAAAGVAGVALIGGALLFSRRRRHSQQQADPATGGAPWFNQSGLDAGLLKSPQPPSYEGSPDPKYTQLSQELDSRQRFVAELAGETQYNGRMGGLDGRSGPPTELDSGVSGRR